MCAQADLHIDEILTRFNKKAEIEERKKICNKFTLGVKVLFGVSWVLLFLN